MLEQWSPTFLALKRSELQLASGQLKGRFIVSHKNREILAQGMAGSRRSAHLIKARSPSLRSVVVLLASFSGKLTLVVTS